MTLPDPTASLFDMGPPEPCPARFNLAAYALAAAEGPGREKPALRVLAPGPEGRETAEDWSYARLAEAVLRVAEGLRTRGVGPGERVAIRIGNRVDFPLLFLGAVAAGAVAAPVSTQLTPPEFARAAEEVTPALLLSETEDGLPAGHPSLAIGGWEEIAAAAPGPFAETGADDPAFLIFTSGTGGRPKGVLHAQRSAWARRMMWAGWYGLGPEDRVLHAGAFNWTYTLGAGLVDPWAAGASTIVSTGAADPALWPARIAEHGATIFAAVPGVFRQMLRAAGDAPLTDRLGRLRHALTAGEKMPDALAEAWRSATGRPVYEALGMSEISTYVSTAPGVPPRPGTVGRPQPGRRVAVVDAAGAPVPVGAEGVLAVSRRDPGLMLGYWGRAAETAEAFRGDWFLTGDRARMDAEGYVAHLGRADEVMTALGYRVSPAEVEAAMEPHPDIAEIAVAELPVRADLALVAAFVVPAGDWPGEASLEAWARARLAAYKRPRLWIEVPALPRTATGKVVRKRLVESHRRDA